MCQPRGVHALANRDDGLCSLHLISDPGQQAVPLMSRRAEYSQVPTEEQSLQDEEVISGTGEGDEMMEDAEQDEDGYSAYTFPASAQCMILMPNPIDALAVFCPHLTSGT